jgi:hypothetical protein
MPYDHRNPHARTVWLLEQRHARTRCAKALKRIEAKLESALIREAIYYAIHA